MESLKSCGETMENRRIPTPKIAYHSLKFCIYSILRSIKNRKTNLKHSVTDLYGECLLKLAKHINATKHSRIMNTSHDWNFSNLGASAPLLSPTRAQHRTCLGQRKMVCLKSFYIYFVCLFPTFLSSPQAFPSP